MLKTSKMNVEILLLTCALSAVNSARILGIFPMVASSHYILANSLMRGLAEKGHDVTLISPYEEKNPPKAGTYRSVVLSDFIKAFDPKNSNLFDTGEMSFFTFAFAMNHVGNLITEKTLAHPNVQGLLKSDAKFDVVIVEQFVNDALKVFAYHYRAPLILFSTFASNAWINPLVANPAPPSYVPELRVILNPKIFLERFKNMVFYVFGELNRHFLFFPAQNRIMKKYFPDAPDLSVLLYNASLVLLNSHLSTNKAVPRVPNMIDIGGFHLGPSKKLPQDLQEFLDSSKQGVIYFSMGSALQSVNLPPNTRDWLLRVFSKLKQNVLWKWEADVLPGQPANVKLGKWLPQHDILAHPNVKVFITHGGLLSLTESVYHGVPVLSIPVFGDQTINAAEAAANGCGRYIIYNELSEKKLTEALNDLLENPRYRENMRRRSEIMKDRAIKPMNEANYWIEYVIRHHGAPHLRVTGLELAWYQYLALDVAGALATLLLLILYLSIVIIKIVKNVVQQGNKNKVKTS